MLSKNASVQATTKAKPTPQDLPRYLTRRSKTPPRLGFADQDSYSHRITPRKNVGFIPYMRECLLILSRSHVIILSYRCIHSLVD